MSYIKPVLLSVLLVATSQISFGSQVPATASAQEKEVLIPRSSETTRPPASADIRIIEPAQVQEFDIVPPTDGFESQIPDLDGEPTIPDQQSQQLGNSAVEAASRLRNIVQRIDPNAELLPNGATFRVQNIPVTLVYDINADRMRLISPASSIEELDAEMLVRLMQANFDTALDSRYALAGGILWATYLHPLSTLSSDQFGSGLGQTINLVATFGSTFTSGAIVFGGGDSTQQQRELIEELQDKSKDI